MATAQGTAEQARQVAKIIDINSTEQHEELASSPSSRTLIFYSAPWAQPSQQMDKVFTALHSAHDSAIQSDLNNNKHVIQFCRLDTVSHGGVTKSQRIERVPTFMLYHGKRLIRRVDGANAEQLSKLVSWASEASEDMLITACCESIINSAVVVVCMKGTVGNERCVFCKRCVDRLRDFGVVFESYDVLDDNCVRDRLKEVASWETFPMVFAHGQLIGGVDAIDRLADEKRLISQLANPLKSTHANDDDGIIPLPSSATKDVQQQQPQQQPLNERLDTLINRARIMLFMKGDVEQPKCGFSRNMVKTLREHGVCDFETFDILGDNEVRQGLKTYSKWPTYPQLYVGGEFVGGLDVVTQLGAMGQLTTELGI